ncbi:helix-turn-helix domain-containing protein [Paraliobacillus sediminis]|uniref:helix-turn-helix domain-containing protein n=1 Tax=Paraliobacillus sediminis TaxID=1885916 RepID=UPI000E3E18F5|nr:helix-turn-helix domain-containing protein [Paraliobacillus sediminis]
MEREIITVKEVSLYLGVHPDTIYDMTSQKEIPHFKMRSKILFSKKSIDNWIKDQEKKLNK